MAGIRQSTAIFQALELPAAVETCTSIGTRKIANTEGKILKANNRSFTVEIKNSRRRLATRPKSIWGNTDLKAIARQAEADDPSLFKNAGHTEQATSESGPALEPGAAKSLIASHRGGSLETIVDHPNKQHPAPMAEPTGETASASFTAETVLKTGNVQTLVRRRKGGSRRRAESAKAAARVDEDLKRSMDGGDLDSLGRENLRLKCLLMVQLKAQNAELRDMLARFSN